ncbi:MAG: helix-turn-helix domain-containing protein [Acidimicrobiales bacterium]
MTERTDEEAHDDIGSASYARAVGVCLRRARQQLRLSLQAVETMSSQEFKASVLGAYERGERSISVPRLQRLAILYDVPVDLLLPAAEPKPSATADGSARSDGAELEAQLDSISGPERELLRRFVRMIQAQRRGDGGGAGSSIRSEDIRAIELLLGSSARSTAPSSQDGN